MGVAGRIAVVTGGTSGLGEGVAELLAAEGARVVVTGRDAERGEAVVASIKGAGGDAAFVAADLADKNCGVVVKEGAEAAFGTPDLLVNNAGTFFFKPMAEVPPEEIETALTINFRGPFLITQALLPGMAANGFGRVVFIGSTGGSYGLAMTPLYAATKAALKGLMYALVPEYGSAGITFNCVEPGLISTPLTSNLVGTPELQEKFLPHHPNGRVGIPLDIAHPVLMFVDDNAGHLNAQTVIVDGGNTRTAKHSALPPPPGSSGDL
jgi:NAD(P)-dependent dehydrogenase (short-subunit alcohol dehydrogenase family)